MGNSANYLQYGPIKINLVLVKEYKREPIYADKEQTHYLYTRHTLSVDGVIAQDNEINRATFESAQNAIEVDVIIKHFLTQPRQILKYFVGGEEGNFNGFLLESPEDGQRVDCTNGPKPRGFTLTRINGTNSAQVSFVIQTDINDAHMFGAPKYAILSNSYTMEHIIDQDFYTSRKVSGLIHFRTDVLIDENLSPDDFRELINIPTPQTMKRDLVKVRLHPGSMKMEYSFIDRETHFHLENNPKYVEKNESYLGAIPYPNMKNITRLEITQSVNNMQPSPYSAAQDAWKETKSGNTPGKWGKLLDAGNFAIAAAGYSLPVNEETLTIQVYGNNLSDKHQLEYLIYYIVAKKLPYSRSAGKYNFKLEIDALGSYARIQVSRTSSPLNVDLVGLGESVNTLLAKHLFGDKNNSEVKGMFLDASVLLTGQKFDLNQLHKKSFFSDYDVVTGQFKESLPGVYQKTYINGVLNPELTESGLISARVDKDQMRGSYQEQIFVEGVRSNPTEYPIDPHQNDHWFYDDQRKANEPELHLGDKTT